MSLRPDLRIDRCMLLQQANKFRLKSYPDDIPPLSASWINKFKKRYDIVRVHDDSGGVDTEVLRHWKKGKLNGILQWYRPSEIYNADETGFYRSFFQRTLLVLQRRLTMGQNSQKLELMYWWVPI